MELTGKQFEHQIRMTGRLMSDAEPRRIGQIVIGFIGALGVLVGISCWALASPIGASPDEDYHLASIWCPRPIEGSSCEYSIEDGVISAVVVPESVAQAGGCVWGEMNSDSGCISEYSDLKSDSTVRFDDGGYPWGYYQIQHMLVGKDVERSVLNMRLANIFLGVGSLLAVGVLASPKTRHDLLLASVVAWVPMGVYFVASVNPSSWSITGSLLFGAGLYVATESMGWRRYTAAALSLVGSLMCAFSRGDAAIFVLIIAIAIWLLVPITKKQVFPLVYSMLVSMAALFAATRTGQAGNLRGDGGWGADLTISKPRLFLENVLTIPEHIGRYWGLVSWGDSWLDIPVTGWSTITMVLLAGGVAFAGLSVMYWRKGFSVLLLTGALVGVPVVSLTMRQVYPAQTYQGRYMLPLLAVVLLLLLANKYGGRLFASGAQQLMFVVFASLANGLALQRVMRKHLVGLDNRMTVGFLTFGEPEWWPWGIAPEAVLWGGSIAFGVGIACVLLSIRSERADKRIEI